MRGISEKVPSCNESRCGWQPPWAAQSWFSDSLLRKGASGRAQKQAVRGQGVRIGRRIVLSAALQPISKVVLPEPASP